MGRRSAAICACRMRAMPSDGPHHVDSWMKPKKAVGTRKSERHVVIIEGKRQAYASASAAPCVFDSPWYLQPSAPESTAQLRKGLSRTGELDLPSGTM